MLAKSLRAYTFLFLLTHLTIPIAIWGQVLRGQVKDTKGQAIEGVAITVPELKVGTISDGQGKFKLRLDPAKQLIVSFSKIGYQSLTRLIKPDTISDITVSLFADGKQLNEVVIAGMPQSQAEAHALKRSVVPVTILSSKDIENRASNLDEMLARQAGVQIRQTGGLGSETRISVRGLEGKRVQIFIEGNPLNTPDGSISINDIPIQLIERVEIYKGTVPAWLGGDGLGGAVNIVIKHRNLNYLDVNLGAASYMTRQASIMGKKSFDQQGIEAGLGIFYTAAANNYVMESPYQPGLRILRDHDDYKSVISGLSLKFHKLWFDEAEAEAISTYNYKQLQGIQQEIKYADTKATATVLDMNLRKERFLSGRMDLRYNLIYAGFTGKYTDTSSYMYNFDGSRYLSTTGRGEIGIGPNLTTTIQNEWRHRLNLNYRITPQWSLNFNNTFRSSKSDPNDDVANAAAAPGKNFFNYPGSLFNTVTGLTTEGSLLGEKLLVSAAVKHYYNIVNGFNTSIYTSTPDPVRNLINKLGYNAGVRYNFTDAFLFKASYEYAVRLPQPAELFGDGALITPSISLQPEVSRNTSVGLLYDLTNPSHRRLQLELNAFNMDVDHLIQLAGNVLTSGYVNYQKANIRGTDAEVKYDLLQHWYVSANVTYQRLTDVNQYIPGTFNVPNPTYCLQLPNVPSFFSNWNLEYHNDNFLSKNSRSRIIYEGTYVDRYNYAFPLSTYDDLSVPAYVLHNLAWEQSFRKTRYTITLEAHNITNSQIISNYNNPLPGRNYRIRLRYLLLGKAHSN